MFVYILILAVTAYLYWHFVHKRKGLPPGPTPWPIFGNLLEVLRDPPGEAVYSKWSKKYGDVYTYWMGNLPIVSVTNYKTIMDTFQKDGETYAGRWAFDDYNTLIRGGPNGVIFTEGDVWREQRRFALQVLRDFGLGKNLMQERILDEIQTIFEQVDKGIKEGQKEHDMCFYIDLAIGSIINTLLFGYRFHGDKREEFFDLKKRVQTHIQAAGHPLVLMTMTNPYFYIKLPVFKKHLTICADSGQQLLDYFKQRINEHEQDFNEAEDSKDYVHAFLKEWHRRKENGDDNHYFSHKQLVSMCYDLWVAGQETTSNTLSWGFAYMIHKPEIQLRCHEELDHIIGGDRVISLSDKPNLHYCNAVVNEIQRIANLVPQNVWHKTTKDTTINGHFIAKGVAIVPQVSVVLNDEKLYPEFSRFDPTRFLDSEGKLKNVDGLIPFSVGKRACLGEGMAKMELFLFFVNIMNRYKLSSGQTAPSLERKFGGTVNIDHYMCRIEKRI